jgi:hypothetical protein
MYGVADHWNYARQHLGGTMNRRAFVASACLALTAGKSTSAAIKQPMTGDDPMAAVECLSELESIPHIPALYQLYEFIHPDAASIVPRATVIGWYREDFQPRGPRPALATGVTWLERWTWPVNGSLYEDVAEVSFTQEFADGETESDVVRLVKDGGSWRWFFGRSKEWVEEQNHRFDLRAHIPQDGNAPYGLAALETLNPTILDHLPRISTTVLQRIDSCSWEVIPYPPPINPWYRTGSSRIDRKMPPIHVGWDLWSMEP